MRHLSTQDIQCFLILGRLKISNFPAKKTFQISADENMHQVVQFAQQITHTPTLMLINVYNGKQGLIKMQLKKFQLL